MSRVRSLSLVCPRKTGQQDSSSNDDVEKKTPTFNTLRPTCQKSTHTRLSLSFSSILLGVPKEDLERRLLLVCWCVCVQERENWEMTVLFERESEGGRKKQAKRGWKPQPSPAVANRRASSTVRTVTLTGPHRGTVDPQLFPLGAMLLLLARWFACWFARSR